jgi:hypothetical protein
MLCPLYRRFAIKLCRIRFVFAYMPTSSALPSVTGFSSLRIVFAYMPTSSALPSVTGFSMASCSL